MSSILLSDFESLTETDPTFSVCELGSSTWTRGDIAALVEELDCSLPVSPSIPQGSLVALQCPNGPMFLVALLTLWRRGWVALLVDTTTPQIEVQRLTSRFSCQATIIVQDGWPTAPASMGRSQRASLSTWSELEPLSIPLAPEIAVIKLTSGSAGEPRGVVVSEDALVADETALFRSMNLATERILATIPLSHSYGLTSIAISTLRRDMTIVAPETRHPVSILRTLKSASISFFPSVPAWLEAMVKLSDGQPKTLGSTRLVISAGAPLSAATAQGFRQRYGQSIHPFYGASECGGITFDRTGEAGLSGDLGTALDGVEIELAPCGSETNITENLTPEELPSQGTVVVRSRAVAAGYLEPGPKHRISTDKWGLHGGCFQTSDLGRLEAGVLRILGRQDDVINLKGKKVHPSEVERVLVAMPAINGAYVFSECPDDRPGSPILKALVASNSPLRRQDIQTWCRGQLADHRIPRAVTVVMELPVNQRGKLDRQRARALCSLSAKTS